MTSKMEDDLKNGRRPKKWKMTSKMEDNLEKGRRPKKWKMTSKWKTTSKIEDVLKNATQNDHPQSPSLPKM